ncbi:MAG TPA: hypothetical protein PLX21_09700 [Rhodocyclaceae bacterium]|nr:hypothetical protein [Rhodocyclaceae bacterium]
MKRLLAIALIAASLGGCVVLPPERGPRYMGPPPVVVAPGRPYHYYDHDRDWGYRRW